MASASSLSPATGRWLCRSVRTMSATTLASPGSDLAPARSSAVPDSGRSTLVHSEDLMAGGDQYPEEHPPVSLDPDHHQDDGHRFCHPISQRTWGLES
jgi:hypothetical protein